MVKMNDALAISNFNLPLVYPAILSLVAVWFRKFIPLFQSSSFRDCFCGKDAVDTVAYIIKSQDRRISRLLCCALFAQNYFSGIQEHSTRFCDSIDYIYTFQRDELNRRAALPSGVFTLLATCYSPTCSSDNLCYSASCPRRIEQLRTSKMKYETTQLELESRDIKQELWSQTVPKAIYDGLSPGEQRRQEVIFEIIRTEKEYVSDLDLVQKLYIDPIENSTLIDEKNRESFISDVFVNISQIRELNRTFLNHLLQRQNEQNRVFETIGDIFLFYIPQFSGPYIKYGQNQAVAKDILESEIAENPEFARFLGDVERLRESRKLSVYSFLGRPTTRIGRYIPLLDTLLETTEEWNGDRVLIPRAISGLRQLLDRLNLEVGKGANYLKLSQLARSFAANNIEVQELGLWKSSRLFIREGSLTYRKGTVQETDLHMILLDHFVLLTKRKKTGVIKLFKPPIPLELLTISHHPVTVMSDRRSSFLYATKHPKNLIRAATQTSRTTSSSPTPDDTLAFTLLHLGRQTTSSILYTSTVADRESWLTALKTAKEARDNQLRVFEYDEVFDAYAVDNKNIKCLTTFYDFFIVGTSDGLYVIDSENRSYVILHDVNVERVEVIENDGLLVLAEKLLIYYYMDVLAGRLVLTRSIRLGSNVSCFVVTQNNTATVITASIDFQEKSMITTISSTMYQKKFEWKTLMEFYIPMSVRNLSYMKSKLCVGAHNGFHIVSLQSLVTQELLDPEDENLDFLNAREDLKPLAVSKSLNGEFLVCYDEYAVYVNNQGRRTRGDWLITWAGKPYSIAFLENFVLAFDTEFIEIRDLRSGELRQVIQSRTPRLLYNDFSGTLYCLVDFGGEIRQVVSLVVRK